jgi:uncharacterized protein YdhG (YjbR/CyaY superfamily)
MSRADCRLSISETIFAPLVAVTALKDSTIPWYSCHMPSTVDEYFAEVVSDEARLCLEHLREVIRAAAPEAEESIGYGIPCYKQSGMVISMAAYKNHCSLYPGHTLRDFSEELKGFKMSKGGIQFPHGAPPSDELVTAMVKARVEDNKKV